MDYMQLGIDQFKEKLSGGLKEIVVEEWKDDKGKPVTLYYKPITLGLKSSLNKYVNDPFEYSVRMLIARARNADGEKIYKKINFTEMMRCFDPSVVENIVLEMSKDDDKFIEDDADDETIVDSLKKS